MQAVQSFLFLPALDQSKPNGSISTLFLAKCRDNCTI